MNRPQGMYCVHNRLIMVPVSDEPFARAVFADPYPCPKTECSPATVQASLDDEAAQYSAELWAEYRALVGA